MPRPMTIETSVRIGDDDWEVKASVDPDDIYDIEIECDGAPIDYRALDSLTQHHIHNVISEEYHREVANRAADRADLLGILRGGW